ncbi:hypothetical protein QN277_010893 [Acacia crassicarpa]|uniref:Uncharacterized protein n=1 Tax=Acacia crassicarpa TaxID=499986 RepID=A0AAE1JH73_9FABA|nr:hypothetical protein QN277_010893 [Acacia crassicarpa]
MHANTNREVGELADRSRVHGHLLTDVCGIGRTHRQPEIQRSRELARQCSMFRLRCDDGDPVHQPHLRCSPQPFRQHRLRHLPPLPVDPLPQLHRHLVSASICASFALKAIFHPYMSGGVTIPSETTTVVQAFPLEFIVTFILLFVVIAVAIDTRAVGELAGIAVGATHSFDQQSHCWAGNFGLDEPGSHIGSSRGGRKLQARMDISDCAHPRSSGWCRCLYSRQAPRPRG